jgi:vacuolar-type H+-ATPase subunit F/Vma7
MSDLYEKNTLFGTEKSGFDNKIAAVGAREYVEIFRAVGADTFFTDRENPDEIIGRIANNYPIIIVTDEIKTKVEKPYPVILQLKEYIE